MLVTRERVLPVAAWLTPAVAVIMKVIEASRRKLQIAPEAALSKLSSLASAIAASTVPLRIH